MTERNADQVEFWNSIHGAAWARHSDAVDFSFEILTEALLDAAAIGPGDRVLDVGCGSGGLAIAATARAGPIGAVTGIDLSAPMIERARARSDGATNVTLVLGDATAYPFETASFDALVSRFGVMFFDDPESAFGHLAGALRPGGRVALGVWRAPRENSWAMEPISAARAFLEMPPRPGPEDPGPFSFSDPERVHRIVGAAGFRDIDLSPVDFAMAIGRSRDEALDFAMEMGPLAGPLAAATGARREQAIAAIRNVLDAHLDDDGVVRLGAACWIVTARAP